jgi:hypothetical protein
MLCNETLSRQSIIQCTSFLPEGTLPVRVTNLLHVRVHTLIARGQERCIEILTSSDLVFCSTSHFKDLESGTGRVKNLQLDSSFPLKLHFDSYSNINLHQRIALDSTIRICLMVLLLVVLSISSAIATSTDPKGGYSRAHYVLPSDLLRKGFSFAEKRIPVERPEVARRIMDQINYLLMDRRASMLEWFDRSAQYAPTILAVLKEEKIPKDMIYLSVLLSEMVPNAKTRSGGVGWWALGANGTKGKKGSARWLETSEWDDRRDPVLGTRIACSLLRWLHSRKETEDWLLTICAYVDGTEAIDKIVKKTPGFSYWDLVVPTRSETLIPRLVALKIVDTHRELYGVNVKTPPRLAYDFLGRIKLRKDLPLHVVAKWCKTSPRQIWQLNPGVNSALGILPQADSKNPEGYPLRVPKGLGSQVRSLLVKEGYLAR